MAQVTGGIGSAERDDITTLKLVTAVYRYGWQDGNGLQRLSLQYDQPGCPDWLN